MHYTAKFRRRLSPQPAPLSEVAGWQSRVSRHTVDQIVDAVPGLPTLDGPVPLMVEDALIPVAEQVINVPKIFIERIPPRTSVREPQLVEQLVEVPTTVSYSLLLRTVEQHVDIPVPGGGGSVSSLHGFLPGQRTTSSPSRKRISERIVEQIVHPVSRGSLPGSSSSHSPAGDEERADEPGKGVFRTFPQIIKSAKVTSHPGSELPPHPSSWTAAAQLEDSVEWVRIREKHAGKTYFWNRRN